MHPIVSSLTSLRTSDIMTIEAVRLSRTADRMNVEQCHRDKQLPPVGRPDAIGDDLESVVSIDQLDDRHRTKQEEQDLRKLAHVMGQLPVDDSCVACEDIGCPACDAGHQGRCGLVQFQRMLEDDGEVSDDKQGN